MHKSISVILFFICVVAFAQEETYQMTEFELEETPKSAFNDFAKQDAPAMTKLGDEAYQRTDEELANSSKLNDLKTGASLKLAQDIYFNLGESLYLQDGQIFRDEDKIAQSRPYCWLMVQKNGTRDVRNMAIFKDTKLVLGQNYGKLKKNAAYTRWKSDLASEMSLLVFCSAPAERRMGGPVSIYEFEKLSEGIFKNLSY